MRILGHLWGPLTTPHFQNVGSLLAGPHIRSGLLDHLFKNPASGNLGFTMERVDV
jgi:hypothetical protein